MKKSTKFLLKKKLEELPARLIALTGLLLVLTGIFGIYETKISSEIGFSPEEIETIIHRSIISLVLGIVLIVVGGIYLQKIKRMREELIILEAKRILAKSSSHQPFGFETRDGKNDDW